MNTPELFCARAPVLPDERTCSLDLLGKQVWDLLLDIERFSENWVLYGVPRTHSYGRLPDEEEIRAWPIPRSTGYWLYSLVRMTSARTVLEIGTSLGYSALWMASALQFVDGQIYTCEVFDPKIVLAKEHFAKSGLRNITLIEGDAAETINDWNQPIDILFLDADPENYRLYWSMLKPRLHKRSILIMDNAVDHRSETAAFIDEVEQELHWSSWVLPFDHGLLFATGR
jgi:predicted O-methyltransferase YrrM